MIRCGQSIVLNYMPLWHCQMVPIFPFRHRVINWWMLCDVWWCLDSSFKSKGCWNWSILTWKCRWRGSLPCCSEELSPDANWSQGSSVTSRAVVCLLFSLCTDGPVLWKLCFMFYIDGASVLEKRLIVIGTPALIKTKGKVNTFISRFFFTMKKNIICDRQKEKHNFFLQHAGVVYL